MSTIALDTRQQKEKWLLRPISWAGHLAWVFAVFGFVYYYFEIYGHETVVPMLIGALAATSVLLIWGLARIQNAIRGRY